MGLLYPLFIDHERKKRRRNLHYYTWYLPSLRWLLTYGFFLSCSFSVVFVVVDVIWGGSFSSFLFSSIFHGFFAFSSSLNIYRYNDWQFVRLLFFLFSSFCHLYIICKIHYFSFYFDFHCNTIDRKTHVYCIFFLHDEWNPSSDFA